MTNVIVTGGTGFIGSWLVEHLLNHGIRVLAIVRDRKRILPNFVSNTLFSYIERDLDSLECEDIFDCEWDCFYHLAWEGVSPEKKNDYVLQLKNVNISIRMINLAKKIGCKKFIASGTVAEYVFNDGVMDFTSKQSPNDFYGAAKVSTHYFLDVEANQIDMPFIWAILPSTFGERRTDNNIITYTIRSLIRGEEPQYGDLNQMWDFLYVSEVVRALFLIGEKGISGKIYGIGSGKYRTLKDYIVSIRDMINPQMSLKIGINKYKTKQLMSSCVDISVLSSDTGFYPMVSFEEGIERTISYMRQQINNQY